ncbi:MAG TPA: glycosyltransferase [Anaerolineae bacterium]
MRIAIIASGSRGDVEPYLALGQGLTGAGHTVRLITHENFETLVTSCGVEFWPVAGNVQDIAQSAVMRERLERGSFVAILRQMAREAERGAVALAKAALAACQGMNLILAGLGGIFVGLPLAEKLNLPLLQAYYIPFTATRAYPSFIVPRLSPLLGYFVNRPSYALARQLMWQSFRRADRVMRRDVLGIRPAPLLGPYDAACTRGLPILYGYSPAVIPPPSDWGADIHVTGYWFLDTGLDWAPPPALDAFLQAGPPPVYVGFGSMGSRDPQQTAQMVLQAVKHAGQRAVIHAGWGGMQAADLPDSVMMIDSVPFSWLFPRMAAVVHHGGAGTTAAGLRAGVPAVVVPFFADQPYWGQRVADLGVGPAPLPRRRLTAEHLADAIQTAVTDPSMRRRAAALGAQIRAEDGVARAVEVVATLEQHMG